MEEPFTAGRAKCCKPQGGLRLMKYRWEPGRLLRLGKYMHSNWLHLQARNALHKDAEQAGLVKCDMHTLIWLSSHWGRKKENPSSMMSNWVVTNRSLHFQTFSPFTPPIFCHPLRRCYLWYSIEEACDLSRYNTGTISQSKPLTVSITLPKKTSAYLELAGNWAADAQIMPWPQAKG